MSWERFKEIIEYIGITSAIIALWIFIFLFISYIGIMIYEAIQ